MFKKDTILNGILIAIITMGGSYLVLYLLNTWGSEYFFGRQAVFQERTIRVISIFMAVFPFRYYMMKTEKEWIGRGILLVTFIVGLTYFFYYMNVA